MPARWGLVIAATVAYACSPAEAWAGRFAARRGLLAGASPAAAASVPPLAPPVQPSGAPLRLKRLPELSLGAAESPRKERPWINEELLLRDSARGDERRREIGRSQRLFMEAFRRLEGERPTASQGPAAASVPAVRAPHAPGRRGPGINEALLLLDLAREDLRRREIMREPLFFIEAIRRAETGPEQGPVAP
ncbi:MAG: hypothetical protein HY554_09110 [Elusimicrobia bacterium]|nr:hypothetical protein [Elusimicrobiota bacterium]